MMMMRACFKVSEDKIVNWSPVVSELVNYILKSWMFAETVCTGIAGVSGRPARQNLACSWKSWGVKCQV